jgi:twitching motility protein PilT
MNFIELITQAYESGASDLHLGVNLPILIRKDGQLMPLDPKLLTKEAFKTLLTPIIPSTKLGTLAAGQEIDFTHDLEALGRARVNIFQAQQDLNAAIRLIPACPLSLEALGAPPLFKNLAHLTQGLVLLTGPTGCGKSTTAAAIIDHINTTYAKHIITIEDPIEFIYPQKKSLLHQRQVGTDTLTFPKALRATLRQDPDVILIGEMRDVASIQLALRAAETGHLVFSTLHTNSAAQTIDRIVHTLPNDQQHFIQKALASSLKAIISQVLVKTIQGPRVAVYEILLSNPATRNLIREHKLPQLYSAMQTGGHYGMQTMQQSLAALVITGVITQEQADIVNENF